VFGFTEQLLRGVSISLTIQFEIQKTVHLNFKRPLSIVTTWTIPAHCIRLTFCESVHVLLPVDIVITQQVLRGILTVLMEERRLWVSEKRVLRRIFGPKRDAVTGEWRKLHNEELSDLYS